MVSFSRDQTDWRDERAEWLESVDGLIRARGAQAPARILDDASQYPRGQGVATSGRTPYRNTIPAAQTVPYPGDLAAEERLSAYLRWNAMAMVVRANERHAGLGGHLSTYASTLSASTRMESSRLPFGSPALLPAKKRPSRPQPQLQRRHIDRTTAWWRDHVYWPIANRYGRSQWRTYQPAEPGQSR